jgi:hypothetical protein
MNTEDHVPDMMFMNEWSCGLTAMDEMVNMNNHEEIRYHWQCLLGAYVNGVDNEWVPRLQDRVQPRRQCANYSQWQSFGGYSVNRLDKWGSEWLQGLALGLVYLLTTSAEFLSTDWHVIQLELQNILVSYQTRFEMLSRFSLYGDN